MARRYEAGGAAPTASTRQPRAASMKQGCSAAGKRLVRKRAGMVENVNACGPNRKQTCSVKVPRSKSRLNYTQSAVKGRQKAEYIDELAGKTVICLQPGVGGRPHTAKQYAITGIHNVLLKYNDNARMLVRVSPVTCWRTSQRGGGGRIGRQWGCRKW